MGWYKLSYPTFLNQSTNSKEDMIRLIAYAYSWMPTIPDINPENTNWDHLIGLVNDPPQKLLI
jgi:hypothetical protein